MSWSIILTGFVSAAAALAVHLAVWRAVRVRREIFLLITIFLILPVPALWAFAAARGWTGLEFTAAALVHTALALVYLLTYPAIKEEVPTFRVLLLVHSRGERGITPEEIVRELGDDEALYSTKIAELEGDAFVKTRGGTLALTWAGAVVARVFILYRRLLGLPTGLG